MMKICGEIGKSGNDVRLSPKPIRARRLTEKGISN